MRNTILCILLVTALGAPASGAAEPAQALLNELTRPHSAPGLPSMGGATGLEEVIPEDKGADAGIPEFFTLDELQGAPEESSELALSDESTVSDLPLTLNSQVEYFIHKFQSPWKQSFNGWLTRATRYLPMMKEIMRKEGLPEDLVYVAMIESGFTLNARSVANAVGPWQFMSATGRRYALRIDQWVDERKDPVKATVAAAMYLKELYGIFNNDWYLATAGYNAGENKILRAIGKYNTSDFWEISRGSYLKRETKDYVPKLLAAAIIAKDPAKYGFTSVTTLPTVEYDTVVVPGRTDLELVARLTGTTYQSIRELNPSLRHWCTPPNYPNFELKIPKGTKGQFEMAYAKIPEAERFTEKPLYTKYAASRKDSLVSVARRFGTTPAILAELNGMAKKDKVSGRTLIVPVRQSVDFVKEGRGSAANKSAIRYYTVRKGDTLQSLSRRFNVSAAALVAWNNIRSKTALKPGKRLIVAKGGAQSKAQS
jgi:membrane-bound lytic murein transglycosylase D